MTRYANWWFYCENCANQVHIFKLPVVVYTDPDGLKTLRVDQEAVDLAVHVHVNQHLR
jgi:hypothetical protein